MYLFGHLGLGSLIADSATKSRIQKLSLPALLLGTLLPDLIDKTIYYGLSFATGLKGADLGMIAGTRNFAHTAVFLFLLVGFSLFTKSEFLKALTIGVSTHLLLDNLGDLFLSNPESRFRALLWPFLGWQFPVIPYHDLSEHLKTWGSPVFLALELIGLLALIVVVRRRRLS